MKSENEGMILHMKLVYVKCTSRSIFIHRQDVYPLGEECVLSCVCVCVCVRINMTQWWALLIIVYLSMYLAASQHHRKALYPSAYRIRRGAYSLIDPTFQRSAEDVNLLFEILLAGMQIQGGENNMLIPDEELASLRSVEKLEVICEDVLPKRLSDIRRLTVELGQRRGRPLSWQDFERTVLTLVYATQTVARVGSQQQREAWTDAAVQLFKAVQKDLRPS
ncbi:protein FAM180A-like [Centropristis striata]|uniref:protein FAM180A-like n=1 Tax=Centropristis striata TaxID=184440 RepID=UPI0027E1E877|nr:protein FAM180A-like [Centropristis striata]